LIERIFGLRLEVLISSVRFVLPRENEPHRLVVPDRIGVNQAPSISLESVEMDCVYFAVARSWRDRSIRVEPPTAGVKIRLGFEMNGLILISKDEWHSSC